MAAGWKHFTGESQYPELTANSQGSSFTYGSKQNRNFRMGWLQGRRDDALECEMLSWISRVTGTRLPKGRDDVIAELYDGKILCNFLSRISPGSLVRPINEKPALFSANENVTTFLDSLKRIGLGEDELFFPNELLEKKDLAGLVSTLKKLQARIQ